MCLARIFGMVGLVCLIVGCSKSKSTNPEPTPNPNPQPGPGPGADPHELDPAKHVVPATPASGRINGAAFTPDRVELEGTHLRFRAGKDFFADQEVSLSLSNSAKLAEGHKVTVRPDEAWSGITPMVQISTRKGQGLPDTQGVDKYALTLELGKPEKGKIAGKIYLCVPDAQKSYLAGTFVAQRKRSLSEPPGEDEVPFVHGTVSPPLKTKESLTVGYVGVADGKVISDSVGLTAFDDGSTAAGSTTFAPRQTTLRLEKFSPRFDFTNLPPGRYMIYARVKGGPAVWSWVEVAAGARVPAELKLDATKLGTVDVKLAGGSGFPPKLVPADLGPAATAADFANHLGFGLDFNSVTKDGVATFANVPAGKYQVLDESLRVEVDVTAGKTATVELKPEKK